jgi:hypothetical protein
LNDLSFSRPLEGASLRVISLGAGVQSSTLALMAARGEAGPMPDCAIFADTQWEPAHVYEWLDWLEKQLPFPVYRVTRGNLREKVVGGGSSMIPAFVGGTPVNRGCTRDYKVTPIVQKVRALAGYTGRPAPKTPVVEQWIGISLDEIQRMKGSRQAFIQHRWPLIEKRMRRSDCIRWMEERQYPRPPRSACSGCPFHSNAEWRDLRDNHPEAWADAVLVDAELRNPAIRRTATREPQYLHRSGVPLDQVDLTPDGGVLDLFNNECEGMCGV